MAIDARLVGIWNLDGSPDNLREIRKDGKEFFFNPFEPFSIDSTLNPERLVLNAGTLGEDKYDRISGTPNSGIVGVWSDKAYMKPNANVTEVYYKANNTFEDTDSTSPLEIGTGEYTVTGGMNDGQIQRKFLTTVISTSGNIITFRPVWQADDVGTFLFSNGDNTVTFEFGPGQSMVYQRVI